MPSTWSPIRFCLEFDICQIDVHNEISKNLDVFTQVVFVCFLFCLKIYAKLRGDEELSSWLEIICRNLKIRNWKLE